MKKMTELNPKEFNQVDTLGAGVAAGSVGNVLDDVEVSTNDEQINRCGC